MGKKKPKDDEISAPSSIFTALFGGIRDETAVASSIFSDSNPFKRKHEELEAGNETIVNSKNSDTLNSDIAELKKRKKNRNEKSNLDSDFAEGEEATNKNPNLSSESDGTSENEKGEKHGSTLDSKVDFNEEKKNPNLDIEGKEGSEKRKRKKRKRDDVEREYEEKKYGVKAEEEKEKKEVVGKVVVGEKRKQSDKETEDMLIHSKEEGFDDESKLLRTVFVGNLPVKVKKKALMKEFSNFGEIESVRIRSVPILDVSII